MAMVDVDGSNHLSADSQPKSVGLVCGLSATRRSVCIRQMIRVNSRSDHGHDDSTINIVVDYYYYYYYYYSSGQVHCAAQWVGWPGQVHFNDGKFSSALIQLGLMGIGASSSVDAW